MKLLLSTIQKKYTLNYQNLKIELYLIYMDKYHNPDQYIAIIISEVKSSSRELYPLTKNYPMCLLTVGTKKLIIYQLEALVNIPQLSKVIIILGEDDRLVHQYIEFTFLPLHRSYPHKIEFSVVRDFSNIFEAVSTTLKTVKQPVKGYILIHADTINSVPLQDVVKYHQQKNSDLTLLVKAKRELSEQQKKPPEGELETQIDNLLLGQHNECLFIDMADQIQNSGVKIDPSILRQVRKATFRRILDSKCYVLNQKIASIIKSLSSEEIYQVKPWLIQLLVQNQTNKKLLQLAQLGQNQQLKPLRIFAHFNQQDTYIRKINSKKIYQTLNFDSLIRGPKQREVLMPTPYSDKLDQQYKAQLNVAQSAVIGTGARLRRSCVGAGCKIGKNVEMINSIILQNVQIKDGCKISECVIGSGSFVGEGATIKNTYSQSNCRVADGVKIQSQILIKSE